MAKVVLGNDPFRRSAAPRPEQRAPEKPAPSAPKPAPRKAQPQAPAKAAPKRTAKGAPKVAPKTAPKVAPRTAVKPAPKPVVPVAAPPADPAPAPAPRPAPEVAPRPPPAPPRPLLVEVPREEAANDGFNLPVDAGQPPLSARAVGALALARDILFQTLDRPGLKRLSDVADGVLLALRTGAGLGAGGALDPFGKDPALLTRLEPLLDFLYERYWRVSVENARALPSGPAILVANHAGALPLDGPLLALSVSRERPDLHEPRWLVEDQVFHAPFWGTLLNRLGAIRASPENALRLLEERRPVLVFPEGVQGTRKGFRERYRLKRFGRGGFVKLALRTGAPIVPVAIVGSEEATPVLASLPGGAFGLPYLPLTTPVPLPVRWAIRFGAPIHVSAPEGDELAFVQQLTERTRGEIETMLQSLLRERRR